ncbi:MAG: pitrilysin family protein [Bacteroidota bacterium]|nr:pitrilysin family protein [Bacteroidota bacterium]
MNKIYLKSVVSFILIFVLVGFAVAQLDRSVEPQPGPSFKMSIPKIERATLDNGLRIVIVEHRELPVVQVQFVLRSGADADISEKAGVASLTADMLDEGTKTRTALQIADELDFIGASAATSANYDASIGSLLTLKEHLSKAMEIFSDIILNPNFPENEFERLKSELLTDLLAQKVRPDIIAGNIFNAKVFGSQNPYSQSIDGSEETVKDISLNDIKDFYGKYYAPNNASVIIVGDITKSEAVAVVKQFFGHWKKKEISPLKLFNPQISTENKIYLINKDNAPQSQIRIGNIGIERRSPDFYAVNILNQILGASNGRLFLNLREAKGYTYGAYANFAMRKSAGPFVAYAGVKTEVTDSALVEFFKEINRIRDEIVSDTEFELYKTAVIQRLPRIFETPAQIAGQLMALELFNLPDDFFSTLVEKYKAITPIDIQRAAQKYLHPKNLTVVIVGDVKSIKEKIEKLGFGKIILCDETGKEL